MSPTWWVGGGAGGNGGNPARWLHQHLRIDHEFGEAVDQALRRPIDPTLLFLPYLHGERSPLWDSTLTGSFLGLAAHHESIDLFRAGIDAVTTAALALATAVWRDHPRSTRGSPADSSAATYGRRQ